MSEVITELGDDNYCEHYGCGGGEIHLVYCYSDRSASGWWVLEIENYHQEHDNTDDCGVFDNGGEIDEVEGCSANQSDNITP